MQQRTPKRPRNVPASAQWVAPLWQYGTLDEKGGGQGLWCGWKKTGALAYVAHLVDGAVEGPSVEFHPDGALYRRATYHRGALVGVEELFAPLKKSDEPFPADKPVARVVIDHGARSSGAGTRYFLADGAECNPHGTPLSALVLDAPFVVRDAETFAKTGLSLYAKHRVKMAPSNTTKAKSTTEPGLSRALAGLWAFRPRPSFRFALSMLERGRLPKHLGELRTEPCATLSAIAAGATAESIIARGQRSVGALPIVSMLAGLLPFGVTTEGDVFALSLFDDDDCAVYRWAESPRDLFVESDDFPTFALWCAAKDASAAGMISARARGHLAKLFATHLHETALAETRWPATSFDDKETRAQARHRRSAWLASFLAGQPLDAVAEHFAREDAGPLDRALAARVDRPGSLDAPDLVYALLRGQVVGDPRLPTLLDVAEKQRATLVSSTAALVRSLEGGRNRLGTLRDLKGLSRALKPMLARA